MVFIYEAHRKEEEEKYRIVMRNNQKLQEEVEKLGQEIERIVEEEENKEGGEGCFCVSSSVAGSPSGVGTSLVFLFIFVSCLIIF